MPPAIKRVEPVLNVRDVKASTAFFARLGFVERFRDDAESPRWNSDPAPHPTLIRDNGIGPRAVNLQRLGYVGLDPNTDGWAITLS